MDRFADLSGISKGYISMLERNKTQRGDEPSPSLEMYYNVARVIGIDFDDLIRMVNGKIIIGNAALSQQHNVSDEAMDIAKAYDKATPKEQVIVKSVLSDYLTQPELPPLQIAARGGNSEGVKLAHPELGLEGFPEEDTEPPK